MKLPLSGIRVVEFEGIGPGPLAGRMLADMGAEVTVIARPAKGAVNERLGGAGEDPLRRGKHVVRLDPKQPAAAAQELRQGVRLVRLSTQGPDLLRAMTPEMVFDLLAVRLNHEKADGLSVGINFRFTDSGDQYALELSNSVLNNTKGRVLKNAQVSLTLSTMAFMRMTVGQAPLPELLKSGEVKLEGDSRALGAVFANLEAPNPQFTLVAP